jgi:hypothetical protein
LKQNAAATLLILILLQASSVASPLPRQAAITASVISLLVWNPMQLDGIGGDYAWDAVDGFERGQMFWLWEFEATIREFGPVRVDGHLEFNFGQIAPSPANASLGFTPVIEWHFSQNPIVPYLETGLGAYYFSLTEHDSKSISTNFQFGEVLGVASRFGDLELGVRYQHHSNGNLAVPNNGYNFYGLTVKYWY